MAEQPQSGAVSAAFPAPPPFYKHFTPENLARLQEIQSSAASQEGPTTEDTTNALSSLDLAALPLELRYLIPPLPPTGQYRSFNTVEDATPPQPTPSTPDPQHLKALTRTLLLHFLSLSHILATNPVDYPPKWDEIRDVFLEAHKVVNEYRPHQARETLIQLMEEQVRRGREEIRLCKETELRVKEALNGLSKDVDVVEVDLGRKRKRKRDKDWEDRRVWEMLHRDVAKT